MASSGIVEADGSGEEEEDVWTAEELLMLMNEPRRVWGMDRGSGPRALPDQSMCEEAKVGNATGWMKHITW